MTEEMMVMGSSMDVDDGASFGIGMSGCEGDIETDADAFKDESEIESDGDEEVSKGKASAGEDFAGGESETHEGSESEREAPRPSRAQERIRALLSQNKALSEKLGRVHGESEQAEPGGYSQAKRGVSQEAARHPALAGAEFDDHGNVIYEGVPVTPEFAIRQHEMAQELASLRGTVAAQEEMRLDAEHRQQLEQVQNELLEAVTTDIGEKRAAVFPDLDKRQSAAVDRQLFVLVDNYVTDSINEGLELTPELIGDSTERALNDLRETFGIFGTRQMRDNERHAETYRVKPTGMPGVPAPKPIEKMTKAERETFADQAARAAEAMRRGRES